MRGLDTGNCDYNLAPWWVNYTWTYTPHGLDSKRSWNGYSGAPSAVLECTVCHDPHGSYTATNTLGNPYMIRDFVNGTPFVDDGTRIGGFNGPPWETYGTSGDVVVTISGTTVDWGDTLCNKCHGDWVGGDWWHDMCNGCQTCHSHGQSWDGYDWEGGDDDTPCSEIGGTSSASLRKQGSKVMGIQVNDALPSGHQEIPEQSCSECHLSHN